MKYLSIGLVVILMVAILLFAAPVYADDGEDPGINADIVVAGDNPDVGVDILGDNADVWINGKSLSDIIGSFTSLYTVQGGSVGVNGGWVQQKISEALAPLQSWAESQTAGLDLTMEGLAKVIQMLQEHSSQITNLAESLDSQGHVASLRESASVQRMSNLESQQAQFAAKLNDLEDSYNMKLITIIGAFSLVVIGLAIVSALLWRRSR
jgi:hypothetical protein